MDDWLLYLGAGASVARPTDLPLFDALSRGVLNGLGWFDASEDPTSGRSGERVWARENYPAFPDPDVTPEVLFGSLRRFKIDFVDELARVFANGEPNAVHVVAAHVLQSGGCVWTTNVDTGIEAACQRLGFSPPLAGRARAPQTFRPLAEAQAGTLVKLHGTVADPPTMAFTDRELMSPLSTEDVRRLAALAHGRKMILYGYRGADADLADLVDAAIGQATQTIWCEPALLIQEEIRPAFRNGRRIEFRPVLSEDRDWDVQASAAAFLEEAEQVGVTVPDDLKAFLKADEKPAGPPSVTLDAPGIVHARLVERFGPPEWHADALQAAREEDLPTLQPNVLIGHLRWALSNSLYHNGFAKQVVAYLAEHRWLLAGVHPRRVRDYLITRANAVLLRAGDPEKLGNFVDWAIDTRQGEDGEPYAIDLYYRAQARRYDLRPDLAGADADAAVQGLESVVVSDPERLAGALLESGMSALYGARVDDALARGFELRYRRGRYAIQVWRGWGAWLETIASCYLGDPKAAGVALEEVERRFRADGRPGVCDDLFTASLLCHRVVVARGAPVDGALLEKAQARRVKGRYRDDLDLILAEFSIVGGNFGDARQRLTRVNEQAKSKIAVAMSELGLAELRRIQDHDDSAAAAEFSALAQCCEERGATWLQVQALLGAHLCGDESAESQFATVAGYWPATFYGFDGTLASLALGEPRVLWLLTV